MSSAPSRPWLFVVTVFWSAVLLLVIQPIMTKAILPWFGGTAGVWTSSMLFYQCMLLLGYLYAHVLAHRLSLRSQMAVHVGIVGLSLLLMPLRPSEAWKPNGGDDPLGRILALLATSVGLPYFLLSTTSPLVQSWLAQLNNEKAPYRLFAISNLGSLIALLSYPFVIEPLLPTRTQLWVWSLAYVVFAALIGAIAWRAGRSASNIRPVAMHSDSVPGFQALLWISLAAVPSVLWLALANHLSQDVAAVPFVWVVPLAIYLLSFVLCFDSDRWYRPQIYRWLLPFAWAAILFGVLLQQYLPFRLFLPLYATELFLFCMFCHGELARRRPAPSHVTAYYLSIAVGGAVGGIFVGLIAPRVFNVYLELPLGVLACIVLALSLLYTLPKARVVRVGGTAAAGVAAAVLMQDGSLGERNLRNFYGTLQVKQTGSLETANRSLYNGSIQHGVQFVSPERSRIGTTYYGPASGAVIALEALRHEGMRVGVIGLGVGTLATYGRPGDYYRFYEINPAVIHLAGADFRYLRESAARCEVAQGDARLTLEREEPENFDLLAVDAFSGDSIPVHLLTREAFALYFRHLRPAGALAIHVTNKHLDLAPVVKRLAESYGRRSFTIHNSKETDRSINNASWAIVTANNELARKLQYLSSPVRRVVPVWSDDYSNLFRILK